MVVPFTPVVRKKSTIRVVKWGGLRSLCGHLWAKIDKVR